MNNDYSNSKHLANEIWEEKKKKEGKCCNSCRRNDFGGTGTKRTRGSASSRHPEQFAGLQAEAEGASTTSPLHPPPPALTPSPPAPPASPSQPQTLPQHYVMHGASAGLPGVALDLQPITSPADDAVLPARGCHDDFSVGREATDDP